MRTETMARAIDSHLPAGREPGPQSLRVASEGGRAGMLPAMAVLFLACFIGIPLVVISLTDAEGVIFAVLGVLAVVFVVAMWLLARSLRARPAETVLSFEVLGEPLEVRRGGEVEAELTIYDRADEARRLEVGIVCVERYDHPGPSRGADGERERVIGEDVAYERWLPARRTDEPQIFRFRIPLDAPYSHEGACLSFAWRLSAREPAARGGSSDEPIWVLP